MNWVFLALLAPFVYAINVFLDKYLISSRLPNYRSLPIFSTLLALPVSLGILFYSGFVANWFDAFLVILSGVFTIWAFSFYLEALIKEETSLIIIFLQLVPVMVFGLSYLVLGESVTVKQLIGFILLFLSSILASIKKQESQLKLSRAVIFILIADFLWAIPYILIKFASITVEFTGVIMYESFGVVIGGLILWLSVPATRNAFLKTIKQMKGLDLGLIVMNEGLFLGGKILTYSAVVLGPAALVSILGSTQIFFGILFGLIMAFVMPKVFKEDISRRGFIKKALFGLMAFLGIVLIS